MKLPDNVERLLWEYDIDALREESEIPEVVLERVMARGGWHEMCWLLASCDRRRLRVFLEDRGARVLAPRELAFWALACSIPEDRASMWIHKARTRQQAWRG